MSTQMKIVVMCCLSFSLLTAGCAGVSNSLVGNKVSSGPVVKVEQGGPDVGTWQTFNVVTDYNYSLTGDSFEISGAAVLGQSNQMMYERIIDLRVFLFLLDSDYRVLQGFPVARSLTGEIDEKLTFKLTLKAPPGMTAFSFGYDGHLSDDFNSMSFFLLPLNK